MIAILELNKVYHGDCLGVMKDIPDGSVDLIVTDPPYLMDYRSGRRKVKFDKITGDRGGDKDLISGFISESHRVLKDNTAIYMYCSWHNIDFFKREFEKYFKLKNIIVWNKNNHGSGDLKGSYAPKHEFVLFGHKGRSLLRTKRQPDVLNFDKVFGKCMVHPTEKPVDMIELFIEANSDVGDVILDPFLGSGTTAVAAINTNRNFIGIEKEWGYCEIANERIKETIELKSKEGEKA